MDFMLENLNANRPKVEKPWPENFYAASDPARRRKMLNKQMKDYDLTEEDEERKEYFDKRYRFEKDRCIDTYLMPFLTLVMYGRDRNRPFQKKKMEKEIREAVDILLPVPVERITDEAMVYLEMRHAAFTYLDHCKNGQQYNSVLLGLGKKKDDALVQKIAQDVKGILYLTKHSDLSADSKEKIQWIGVALKEGFAKKFSRERAFINEMENI